MPEMINDPNANSITSTVLCPNCKSKVTFKMDSLTKVNSDENCGCCDGKSQVPNFWINSFIGNYLCKIWKPKKPPMEMPLSIQMNVKFPNSDCYIDIYFPEYRTGWYIDYATPTINTYDCYLKRRQIAQSAGLDLIYIAFKTPFHLTACEPYGDEGNYRAVVGDDAFDFVVDLPNGNDTSIEFDWEAPNMTNGCASNMMGQDELGTPMVYSICGEWRRCFHPNNRQSRVYRFFENPRERQLFTQGTWDN